jgi:hypothetical protein
VLKSPGQADEDGVEGFDLEPRDLAATNRGGRVRREFAAQTARRSYQVDPCPIWLASWPSLIERYLKQSLVNAVASDPAAQSGKPVQWDFDGLTEDLYAACL